VAGVEARRRGSSASTLMSAGSSSLMRHRSWAGGGSSPGRGGRPGAARVRPRRCGRSRRAHPGRGPERP
jgi:hypothetical protein